MTMDSHAELMPTEMQTLLGLFCEMGDPSNTPMTIEAIREFIREIVLRQGATEH